MSNSKQTIIAGMMAGSLWGFSEVVLGAFVKTAALPLRGTIMTAIGVGILFGLFAFKKSVAAIFCAVLTTITLKILCAVYLSGFDSIINSSLAVIMEGSTIIIAISLIKHFFHNNATLRSLLTGIGILFAGTMFYLIGNHLAPCSYLKGLNFRSFLLHETIPWAFSSAVTAHLGYTIGLRIKKQSIQENFTTITALTTTAFCWIACALTVIFS